MNIHPHTHNKYYTSAVAANVGHHFQSHVHAAWAAVPEDLPELGVWLLF